MKQLIPLVLSVFLPLAAMTSQGFAQQSGTEDADAGQSEAQQPDTLAMGAIREDTDLDLDSLMWLYRPVVVFADTPADPRYGQQMDRIRAEIDVLELRDVVVLTDTNPKSNSPLRQTLRPRGFQVVLVGKDGQIQLRKPHPISVRELTRTIDKLPSRRREIRDRRGGR